MALLEVNDLHVEFPLGRVTLHALHGISFKLDKGERLGIVGESGAGKSIAAFSILNLIGKPGRISKGEVIFDGENLVELGAEKMRHIRGNRISMIFQDPMMTLNPVLTIGTQMVESLRAHSDISKTEAKRVSIDKLSEVKIPSAKERFNSYPHELSGGMRQRVVIAIALLTNPALIIADEPTTALDVTIQAEILALILDLCRNHDLALMLITHDLAVISQVTQRVAVFYAGKVVEQGPTPSIISRPRHPYTRGLLKALPRFNSPGARLNQIPGSMPTLEDIPAGCSFHPRCAFADDRCKRQAPALEPTGGHLVACHKSETIDHSPLSLAPGGGP